MIIHRGFKLLATLMLAAALVGCTSLPIQVGLPRSDETAERTQTLTGGSTPGAGTGSTTPTAEGTAHPTQAAEAKTLLVWVPPEFDPERSGAANALLKTRLNRFETEHQNTQLEIRIKALDGPGGMIDSLIAASAAAPSALPDLVLLPRSTMESAALKGLLYPYDGLTNILDDQGWFDYALQLARLKDSTYSLPLAGDIMVLAYTPTMTSSVPLSLDDVLTLNNQLLFPAADPQSIFTICMYLAEGGRLQDDQGRPELEETPLLNLLNYYQQARLVDVMPYSLTQYMDDAQVWEAMLGNPHPMAVTWASSFLTRANAGEANLAMAALPTPDGSPFTLATGWGWALAGQDATRRELAVQLAEFMLDDQFLAEWTQMAGYLPPKVEALQGWGASPWQKVIEQVSYSAWLEPQADIISTVGPVLQTAVMQVLSGESTAQAAAQAAANQIKQP